MGLGGARANCDPAEPQVECCGECVKRRIDIATPPFEWCAEDWDFEAECPTAVSPDVCNGTSYFASRENATCLGSNRVQAKESDCSADKRPEVVAACPKPAGCNKTAIPGRNV